LEKQKAPCDEQDASNLFMLLWIKNSVEPLAESISFDAKKVGKS